METKDIYLISLILTQNVSCNWNQKNISTVFGFLLFLFRPLDTNFSQNVSLNILFLKNGLMQTELWRNLFIAFVSEYRS